MLNFKLLSDNLHLFICPMFIGTQHTDPDAIPHVDGAKSSDERVRFPKVQYDMAHFDASRDIAADFNCFLYELTRRLDINRDLSDINRDIAKELLNNGENFGTNSCWCRISKLQNNCIFDFLTTFFRNSFHDIGLVFGFFHARDFYSGVWMRKKASRRLAKQLNSLNHKSLSNDEFNNFLTQLRELNPQKLGLTETPSLEVSLRLPIRKPASDEENQRFTALLEKIRLELHQHSMAIFDQDNSVMHYFRGLGKKTDKGRVKLTETKLHNSQDNAATITSQFLPHAMNRIQQSVKLTEKQVETVHDRTTLGKVLPANDAYLADLISHRHLGFSYFPPNQSLSSLNNIMLIENGRWFWDAAFPYHTELMTEPSNKPKALVLLHVLPNSTVPNRKAVIYAPHSPHGNCICGQCYPNDHNPAVGTNPIGFLRAPCSNAAVPPLDAGDPKSVLEAKHRLKGSRNPVAEAGKDWERAMGQIC